MAIIDTDNMRWQGESHKKQTKIMRVLRRQDDLRATDCTDAWILAERHLYAMMAEYADLGTSGALGLYLTLVPLKRRYDSGERTVALWEAIMQCE